MVTVNVNRYTERRLRNAIMLDDNSVRDSYYPFGKIVYEYLLVNVLSVLYSKR